jgi:ADP-heptose:LPS heptosyltransferase
MKILIVQIGKIGDTVLTTPLIRAIAENIPYVEIHVLLSRRGVPVVSGNPHVKKILLYRKDPLHLFATIARIRLGRYDVWVDPKDHYSTEGAVLARMSGVKKKIGFNAPGRRVFSQALPSQEENFSKHAALRNCAPLAFLGIPTTENIRPQLFPDPRLDAAIREEYGPWDGRTALLNISAGDACRLWDIAKWSVAAQWCLRRGLRVLISFQPSDGALARQLHELQPKTRLFHSSSIREMVALAPLVNVVVTPDTSMVHIASAFNIPQIALFPSVEWNLRKFRPLSDSSIVIQPKPGEQLATIPADDVVKALESIAGEKPETRF